jgi:uncharacterized membrane protein
VWKGGVRPAVPWIVAGLALYVVMLGITGGINIPLNDKLATFGKPGGLTDVAAARDDFEGPWVVWNIIRTVANVAAFGCLGYALVVLGRGTARLDDPATSLERSTTAWAPPA